MESKSVWKINEANDFKSLNRSINVDIAIIGGGITGLSCAYFLKDENFKVAVFEKNKLYSSVTARTTGKITFLQQGLLTKIKNIYNINTAISYYNSQKEAINILDSIIKKENIDCDLKKVSSYYFTNDKSKVKRIKEEKDILERCGEEVTYNYNLPDGLNLEFGISCDNTYVFNPTKYLSSLSQIIKDKISIYENSNVTKIDALDNHFELIVNNHKVKCKKVIIASHYPYFLFPYLMPLKCYLEKSYIGAYKDESDINFSAINEGKPTLSIRYVEDDIRYKLILTNSNNLAINSNDQKNFSVLMQGKPQYLWSNVDIITKDFMPYIGEIEDNLYIATGYNTWGMTNGTLAGSIIKDIIMNKDNEYIKLFSPKRHDNLNTLIRYPLFIASSAYSFISSKLVKNKSWYKSNIEFKKINGENVGIYHDESGAYYIVKNKCPHLGCGLIFNDVEKTWDCPCHGSRFDLSGKSICGPANYDIIFKE